MITAATQETDVVQTLYHTIFWLQNSIWHLNKFFDHSHLDETKVNGSLSSKK